MATAHSRAGRGLFFFRRFLHSPRTVGALCPSTRHLGAAMLRDLDLHRGDVVIEYGPGTGSVTEVIRRKSREVGGLRYLGIERDADFCAILRASMPELEFANAQVEDVERLLAERRLAAPRAIISGLPLIFLPTMAVIVRTASAMLAPGGSFRTFSYLQSWITPGARHLRRHMREHFASFRHSALVWCNFPPALVLRGDKAA